MSYGFQIFCSITITPRRHRFFFHLRPIFRLLTSKIGTVKQIKTLQKRTIQKQFRTSSVKDEALCEIESAKLHALRALALTRLTDH